MCQNNTTRSNFLLKKKKIGKALHYAVHLKRKFLLVCVCQNENKRETGHQPPSPLKRKPHLQ